MRSNDKLDELSDGLRAAEQQCLLKTTCSISSTGVQTCFQSIGKINPQIYAELNGGIGV
jgi:hypothetical protein